MRSEAHPWRDGAQPAGIGATFIRHPSHSARAFRAHRRWLRVFCASGAALALAGCASQAVTRSGFLGSYDDMQPESEQSKNLVLRPRPGQLTGYDALYVDPVEVRIAGQDDEVAMDEVAVLATDALRKELGADWTIVESPATPRTLRVHTALTAVKTSNPALNIAMVIFLPVPPLDNGGLSAESEFVDAVSGKMVGAMAWAGQGLWDPVGYFTPYGHPRQLTEGLAKSVAAVLKRDRPTLVGVDIGAPVPEAQTSSR